MSDSLLRLTIAPQASEPTFRLPFTHATSWANFCDIVRDGRLRPSLCPVFGEKLVYFFCGTVARRASDDAQAWGRSESPIVLVFDPALVACIRCYFPLDTGALAAGRLGKTRNDFRTALRFNVTERSTPWHFISEVYGTPNRYFEGELRSEVRLNPGVFDSALTILTTNTDRSDVDYRCFSVECQTTQDVPLERYFHKVWVPAERVPEMRKLAPFGVRWVAYDKGQCPQFFCSGGVALPSHQVSRRV